MPRKLNVTYLSEKLLRFPERDSRFYRSPDFLASLLLSVKRMGVQVPLHVQPIKDTHFFELVSGGSRLMVARKLGIKELPCIIHHDLRHEDSLVLRGILDLERQDWDIIALSRDMLELHKQFKWSLRKIAKHYNKSHVWIMKMVSVWRMSPELREAVYQREIPLNEAYEILRRREKARFMPSIAEHEAPSPRKRVRKCHICGRDLNFFTDFRKIPVCHACLPKIKVKESPQREIPTEASPLYLNEEC